MGNKGKDTGKMGVRSKEKNIFLKTVTFFKQKDRQTCFKNNVLQTNQKGSKRVKNVISCVQVHDSQTVIVCFNKLVVGILRI